MNRCVSGSRLFIKKLEFLFGSRKSQPPGSFVPLQHGSHTSCEELEAEDVHQQRMSLLASLLKAIEESNGGSLSHLEEPEEKDESLQHAVCASAGTGRSSSPLKYTCIRSVCDWFKTSAFYVLQLRAVVLLDLLCPQLSSPQDSFILLEHQNPP